MATSDEIVIELDGSQNESFEFPPLLEIFRGRWDRQGLPPAATSRLSGVLSLPDIPGICIGLSISERCGRAFDPLGLPEGEATLQKVKAHFKTDQNVGEVGPMQTITVKDMNDDQLATWHHWMKEFVKREKAVLRKGNLDRKLKGRVRIGFHNSNPAAPRYQDQYAYFKKYGKFPEVLDQPADDKVT
jgi:hypothetical protein